ncbi:MAG: SusD/RagB family nutrient-binding outer membrane lipoprotein, partial [Aeriscardovia sp.]|nr:SusD/RagB family nutrient-binding outer membrane lipoprotein [Aeriscardovia sp.]
SNAETAAFQKLHGSAFNGFAGGALSFAERYYSHLDSVTYTGNRNFISPIISAAEVDFLRAEAIQSGWSSGDAKSAFINGMVNSTKF